MKKLLILLAFMPFLTFSQGKLINQSNTINYYWGNTLERSMDKQGLSVRGVSSTKIQFVQTNRVILTVEYGTLTTPNYSTIDSVLTQVAAWIASYKVDSATYADTSFFAKAIDTTGIYSAINAKADTLDLQALELRYETDSASTNTRITNDSIALLGLETRFETDSLAKNNIINSKADTSIITRFEQDSVAKNNALATKWTQGGDSVTYPNAVFGTTANASLRLITNDIERARIDSLGCVFIGATTFDNVGGNKLRLGDKSTVTTAAYSSDINGAIISHTSNVGLLIENTTTPSTNGGSWLVLSQNGASAPVSGSQIARLQFAGNTGGSSQITQLLTGYIASYGIGVWSGANNAKGSRTVIANATNTNGAAMVERLNVHPVGIGLSNGENAAPTSPTYNLSMASGANATWGIEPSASGAGVNWTLRGSAAATGTSNGNGGMFTLAYGKTTGTGFASTRLTRYSRAISTGTADNAESDAMIIPSSKLMADSTSTNLFNVACALGTSAGVTVEYTIKTVGGAGNESHTEVGTAYIMASNDGAVTVTVSKVTTVQHKSDAGTYTVTFAASAANPSVISVTADTDLNVNSVIHYNIINKDAQVINQL